MRTIKTLCMAVVACGMLAGGAVSVRAAEDVASAAARKRMELRVAELHQLRIEGVAGENKLGLLTVLGTPTAADQAVIDAENRDRMILYTAIAQKQATTPERIGAQNAKRIAANAPRGTRIQDAAGAWTRKQ